MMMHERDVYPMLLSGSVITQIASAENRGAAATGLSNSKKEVKKKSFSCRIPKTHF
jgi:hypothetical protein